MQHFQTSFFYDLRELIHNAHLIRKYYYIFKSLNLSALRDKNDRHFAGLLLIEFPKKTKERDGLFRLISPLFCLTTRI